MEAQSRRITNWYSGVAGVAAFFTQPVPGLDEIIVVPIHYWLVVRLARARRVSVFALPWRPIQRIIWYGAGARLGANLSLGLVPVAGVLANTVTACALTEVLARWIDEFMNRPDQPPPSVTMRDLKALFASAVKRSRATDSRPEGECKTPAAAPAGGERATGQ